MPVVLSRLAAIFVAVGLLLASQTLATPERAAAADPGYMMLHFGDDAAGQKLYLSHSTDGLHWNDLNGGGIVLRSTVGTRGVRDPALIRSPTGRPLLDRRDRPVHRLRSVVGRLRQPRQPQPRGVGVDRPGQLVRAAAAQRRRRHPRRPQRLGAGGHLEPRDQRLRPVLGDERLAERRDEAPYLRRPHQGLPQHHHPAGLDRPPRQHTGRRHPDDRVARRYRCLPLRAGLRRRPEHDRGQQLDPGDMDQPRQPLQHRHHRPSARRPRLDEVQGPQRVGPLHRLPQLQRRTRIPADPDDQPVQRQLLQAPGTGKLRHGRHREAPRRDHAPHGRRGEPRARTLAQHPGQPAPVVQPPGPVRAPHQRATCASTQASAPSTTPSSG